MISSMKDDLEKILGALARLFAHEGKSNEVAILTHSKARITQSSFDNWNGGTYGYQISLQLPTHLFAQVADRLEFFEKSFSSRAENISRLYENEFIEGFIIVTELPENAEWRAGAKAWLSGEGVNNQGRARSDNVAPKMCDGLLFRSQPEIELYRALKSTGIAFAPLPVFVRGGESYRRIEPDFVIIKDGITLIVEVDGESFHNESPREAHERLTMLVYEGVHVERIDPSECGTPDKARSSVAKILRVIDKLKTNK
jgi:hypothetical protein